MAKIIRETQKIFGANAPLNQVTSFGSIKSGSPVYTSDIGDLQTSAFETGWSAAVEDDYAPYRQDRNAVDKVTTSQIAYQFQEGIAEWDAGTIYYKGGIVKILNGDKFTLYYSLTDENIGNNPASDNVNWDVWTDNTFPYARITNCITEIPQDIKLELNDGTLTLKEGSKVYVPDGVGKFDEVVISSDKTATRTDSQDCMAWYNTNTGTVQLFPVVLFYSGSTAPSGQQFMFWYDTTNNKCKVTSDSGSTWVEGKSLPLCVVSTDGNQISSIDQVFNGFGYIGSTVFALPGVKGLVPNGRNEDGSLKNEEFTVDKVCTKTVSAARTNGGLLVNKGGIEVTNWLGDLENDPTSSVAVFTRYYNTVRNVVRVYNSGWSDITTPVCLCGYYTSNSSNAITSFTPKLPFRAVDYNDLPTITYWG